MKFALSLWRRRAMIELQPGRLSVDMFTALRLDC